MAITGAATMSNMVSSGPVMDARPSGLLSLLRSVENKVRDNVLKDKSVEWNGMEANELID
jgi:hypothetical protein